MLLKKMERLKHQIIVMRKGMSEETKTLVGRKTMREMRYNLQNWKEKRTHFSLEKRLIVTVLNISLIVSSAIIVAPQSYANTLPTDIQGHWSEPFVTSLVGQDVISGYPDGTFKPDKAITSSEFLSLLLKAVGETPSTPQSGESWDAPIIQSAIQKGIIKSTDEFAQSNQDLTRAETAYMLYNALSVKEKYTYDPCYTPILDQAILDHDQIEPKYRDAVYSMLQKGVLTGNENYFYPEQTFTRGAACVVIERVMDKDKRAYSDDVKGNVMTWITLVQPVESQNTVEMPFENGKPAIDREKVIGELKQHTNNVFSGSLDNSYTYDEYINKKWYGAGYNTIEAKQKRVDAYYNVAVDGVKIFYNFDYRMDLEAYKKSMQSVTRGSEGNDRFLNKTIENIKTNTLVMESTFVTDKNLFYYGSDGQNRTRGRLYFIFRSPSQKAQMYQTHHLDKLVDLKVDQWYYIDLEATTWNSTSDRGYENWGRDGLVYRDDYYITDFIPVNPRE